MKQRVLISLLFITLSVFSICPSNATDDDCTDVETKDECTCAGWGWVESLGGVCTECSAGQYSTGGNNNSCNQCENKPLAANWIETYTGMTSNNCPWTLTCNDGEYFDKDQNSCQLCSGNTYSQTNTPVIFDGTNLTNNTTCTQCPTYSTANEQHTECTCPPNSTLQDNTCKCDADYYMTNGSCEPCPAGSTSTAGAKSINECYMNSDTNFYVTTGDSTELVTDFETVFGSNAAPIYSNKTN